PALTRAATPDGKALAADPKAPLAALVFKSTADPYVGKLSFLRVYQGTLNSNTSVLNASRGQTERLAQLFVPRGKGQDPTQFLAAGDIGAVGKLAVTVTGDSLSGTDAALLLPGVNFPVPAYTVAVSPKSKADSDKLGPSINRLVEEDPSLVFSREPHTGETLLSGQGDVHLDVAFQKAQRKFGLSLVASTPRVPYQETITAKVDHEERFKQQSGGHGHFAHIVVRLEPADRGKTVEFASEVTGGAVPKEFFPYVEKGVLRASSEGALAGFPVVGMRVVLHDGGFHPVDSAGMDFDLCAYRGFKTAFNKGNPVLLEPIVSLGVIVPDGNTGDIIGDLNAKRGRILGMNPLGEGTTLIEAEVPLAEVQRYALDLRAMTQGRGTFTMKISRYEQIPAHLQQKVVEQATKRE
ncbi:MAG: elongation factor G, partial [SAR202 cluster bacterium]|nr:elongation factor G [SAR202 cluster bacterium]